MVGRNWPLQGTGWGRGKGNATGKLQGQMEMPATRRKLAVSASACAGWQRLAHRSAWFNRRLGAGGQSRCSERDGPRAAGGPTVFGRVVAKAQNRRTGSELYGLDRLKTVVLEWGAGSGPREQVCGEFAGG